MVFIEYNYEVVDTVIDVVNSALASGMFWFEFEVMINEECWFGNLVVGMIKLFDLVNN